MNNERRTVLLVTQRILLAPERNYPHPVPEQRRRVDVNARRSALRAIDVTRPLSARI
jgi:hypothetical protein